MPATATATTTTITAAAATAASATVADVRRVRHTARMSYFLYQAILLLKNQKRPSAGAGPSENEWVSERVSHSEWEHASLRAWLALMFDWKAVNVWGVAAAAAGGATSAAAAAAAAARHLKL